MQVGTKAMEGLWLDYGKEVHRSLRVCTVTSLSALHQHLHNVLPVLKTALMARLLLISSNRILMDPSQLNQYLDLDIVDQLCSALESEDLLRTGGMYLLVS